MPRIFISYRRHDTQWPAHELYQQLGKLLPPPETELFIDIDKIPVGENFAKYIEAEVAECDVLLALIGPNWLYSTIPGTTGRRLEDPRDFVRLEIAAALKRDVPVVPVLIDGTPVPRSGDLPEDLSELALRNGVELRRQNFAADVAVLAKQLHHALGMDAREATNVPISSAKIPSPPSPKPNEEKPTITDASYSAVPPTESTVERRSDTFEDLFDGLFSRSGNKDSAGSDRQRGEDVRYRMEIDFLDAVNGGRRRVTMSDGRALDLAIPAGLNTGQTLRLKGQGTPGTRGAPAGDALVEITVGSHPAFRRDGDDLRMELPITLEEAVEGARFTINGPSGVISITIPPHSNSGQSLRISGKGVQVRPQPGNLILELQVKLPPTANDRELLAFLKNWSRRGAKVRD